MEDGPTLVFVEVKHRRSDEYGEPEEAITPTKMRHLEKAALIYILHSKSHERAVRFDVVVIGPFGIRHHENAFMVGGSYY
jgi:putative endonuclease